MSGSNELVDSDEISCVGLDIGLEEEGSVDADCLMSAC